MSIAKKYFEEQLENPEFKKHYSEEKKMLDIEYMFEELKQDIIDQKPTKVLLSEVENLKKVIINIGLVLIIVCC